MDRSVEEEIRLSLLDLDTRTGNEKDVEKNGVKKWIQEEKEKVEKPPRLTNYAETFMHVLKSNIGSGLFAMGDAFKNSGLFLGVGLVMFIGCICLYCQHLMLNVCDATAKKLGRKVPIGFEEAAELCCEHGHPRAKPWGKHLGNAVKTFVCITQSGFCCVYVVFISTNMKQIWDLYLPPIHLNLMMVIVIIPMIMLSWVRDMKSLAPYSVLANALIFAGIIIVIVVAAPDLPSIYTRRWISPAPMIPLFFGTVIYSFEGIGLVTPVKIRSKNPDKFAAPFGPLNLGIGLLSILIVTVGFIGYLRWGDDVKGSVTLNLDPNTILGQATKASICLGVLFTYPIQLLPAINNILPVYVRWFGPFKRPVLAETVLRTCYSLFLFTLAEVVPHLALFITLVGAVSSTALALIFPPLMDFATFYESYGKFNWKIYRNLFIILFGLFGFVTGTFYSLKDIISTFSHFGEEEIS